MKINYFGGCEWITSVELESRIGAEVVVEQRSKKLRSEGLPQFYAHFPYVEVMENGLLGSAAGNGNTPDEAVKDLCNCLAGHRIAINAMGPDRRELDIPCVVIHKQ